MILWFRLLLTLIRGMIRGRLDPLAVHTSSFRAFPIWDGETTTLNAARFWSFCELTVNEANVRHGFYTALIKGGAIGITCNVAAHYIKPVKLLKKFEVRTRALGWDDKFIYRQFQFYQEGELKFEALYRFMIRTWRGKKITPRELVELMGYSGLPSPQLPSEVSLLNYRAEKRSLDSAPS